MVPNLFPKDGEPLLIECLAAYRLAENMPARHSEQHFDRQAGWFFRLDGRVARRASA